MRKRTKKIFAFLFLGGIMATSGVVIAIPGIEPGDDMQYTPTGTPADNYPDEQRAMFCGQQNAAGSNTYVTEFAIPTECTQPLAITSDGSGNVWFIQTNTGKVTKFDPVFERFTEYENPAWPKGSRSMMWGMDYSPDNSIWYSDDAHDSVWQFSIDDETYTRFNFPTMENSMPQRLAVDGSNIIVNDIFESKITILNASARDMGLLPVNIPSLVPQSATSSFVKDGGLIWYTNWAPNMPDSAVLIILDLERYLSDLQFQPTGELVPSGYRQAIHLPPDSEAVNGITVDGSGNIWLADTGSSNFYRFDPRSMLFDKYVTSPVFESVYGNQTGMNTSPPLSRPYWMDLDEQNRIVFNEHAGNRIGIFDPATGKLTEYAIPSMNPEWADCGQLEECGMAQVFDFELVGDKVWFTEWVSNNIGVLDTSIDPTIDVDIDRNKINYDESDPSSSTVTLTVTSGRDPVSINLVSNVVDSSAEGMILLRPDTKEMTLSADSSAEVRFGIEVSDDLPPDVYKVLIGAQTDDLAVSDFFTLVIG